MQIELFNPEYLIKIGKYQFQDGVSIDIRSMNDNPIDWGRITFQKEMPPEVTINKNDKSAVYFGYEGNLQKVFEGHVIDNKIEFKEIVMQDEMVKLEKIYLTANFINATPTEILSTALFKAGISKVNIASGNFPTKNYIVNNKSVLQVIREVNSLWQVPNKYYIQDGTFYWGSTSEQTEKYVFSYGENIISLKEYSHAYELETMLVPFIKHSHKIIVNHPLFSNNEFIIDRLRFYTNSKGFLRTTITFRGDK